MGVTLLRHGLLFSRPKPIVAFWSWEFETTPRAWKRIGGVVDQIWTNSDFAKASFEKRFPDIPVVKVPMPPLVDQSGNQMNWQNKNQTSDKPLGFICVFDFFSDQNRKNPAGAIQSFLKAFGRNTPNAKLTIKSVNGHKYKFELEQLKRLAQEDESIVFLDSNLQRDEVDYLIASNQVLLSLHRAEGFGFNMFDALAMGLCVVATGYSGNLEYSNHPNMKLVNFDLQEFNRQYSSYRIKSRWAEPNTDHAALILSSLERDFRAGKKVKSTNQLNDNYESNLTSFAKELDVFVTHPNLGHSASLVRPALTRLLCGLSALGAGLAIVIFGSFRLRLARFIARMRFRL
mgnify:CR=1 FL=1